VPQVHRHSAAAAEGTWTTGWQVKAKHPRQDAGRVEADSWLADAHSQQHYPEEEGSRQHREEEGKAHYPEEEGRRYCREEGSRRTVAVVAD